MADIVLSSAVRNNLLSLQNTSELLGRTQERLATGLKVNSALDDPTAFFTAASLENRAGDLSRLLDSVQLGVRTIEAADKGLEAIIDLVETAQATARQALLASSTTAVAESTIDHSATGDLTGLAGVADGDQFSVEVGTAGAVTITIDTGDTIAQIANEISIIADVTATVVNGRLSIEATNGQNLTLADVTNSPLDDLGLTAGPVTGTVNTSRQSLATEFDNLRTQIDQLAQDAGFNGVNLLQGDNLRVIFNESATSELTVNGVDFDSGGLGINLSTNSFQDDGSVNGALTELEAAMETLRGQASTFGSSLSVIETRENFTKRMINSLETGAANLTIADTNEEGANMLALQTRQQLSSTALSLASQADQNVLRLFN